MNGTYTVTPSRSGYSFTPSSRTFTFSGSTSQSVSADFTGAVIVAPAAIFGYVRDSAGNGKSGVTVTLSGSSGPIGSTSTASSGYYTFSSLPAATYTVVPSLANWTFTPSSRTVILSGSDLQADFSGVLNVRSAISGYVRDSSGAGISGVTLTLSGTASPTPQITGTSGYYAFLDLVNGTYTVTPSRSGYSFTPSSRTITLSGTTSQSVSADFTGTRF